MLALPATEGWWWLFCDGCSGGVGVKEAEDSGPFISIQSQKLASGQFISSSRIRKLILKLGVHVLRCLIFMRILLWEYDEIELCYCGNRC
ncbi:hypothetical protein HanPSC8_Chr11g0462451 [Helianthus annuus]|nr:hypothetical protein HanIR_Chr11g0516891 [Helianthus annuus]KAJ0874292.1 hypothetical protein HanPSC8_Chr11g0462451 [Helianthus annuus]